MKKFNDANVQDLFNRKLFFAQGTDKLEQELEDNCFEVTLSAEEIAKTSADEICSLLKKIKEQRKIELSNSDYSIDLVYYLWHDVLANALRFGFINAAHGKLPFGCKLQIVDDESEIIRDFLLLSVMDPLSLDNFTDNIDDTDEDESEFILKVYQEIIHKD